MKRKVLLTGAGCCALFSAHAFGALVAGWDFSQFAFSGANSINSIDFLGAGVVEPNYSDLQNPSPGVGAEIYGAIYYEGSFGSTDITPASFSATTAPASGDLSSAEMQTEDGNPFNDPGSFLFLKYSGQTFANKLSLGVQVDSSIVFSADLSSAGEVGSHWEIRFAAKELLSDQSSSIAWEVSTDGSSYVAVAGDPIVTSSLDTEYSVSGGSTLDGADTVYFRATVTGIDTQLLIDNVGIHATIGAGVTTWAGYNVVENPDLTHWADTTADWLGYLNIDSAPFLFSYELDCWLYLAEPLTDANGAWAYIFKHGASSPVAGWGGYPISVGSDGLNWADATGNWIGWVNVQNAPLVYNLPSNVWMFINEPVGDVGGAWAYCFKR